eukprot:CAMPEP_0197443172 /NCGR_PEP_ID=MMETSP1175-20131217/8989_1 /TAXON_ID=1003142 /ORGANISM="Triceratium dubium, Strain CCMP147" /LENGTH=649 /DNA_ID=CAMNT_0042973769 /DNA_START=308 /DNA_END=2257 /DNA_ORIENTATION=+
MRDTKAFAISLVALVVFCVPVLLVAGVARGWNVALGLDGTLQFKTVEDAARFWPEPNAHVENDEVDESIPGRNFDAASGVWYYWKNRPSGTDEYCEEGQFDPAEEPHTLSCSVPQATAATRALVWCLYLIHQCVVWGLIYKAQLLHKDDTKYHSDLRWYNIASFVVNGVFYVLHLIQTHVTYDATAQDVTEASSQASVIVLLVVVLVMEYKHRGLFLGWPAWNDPAAAGCCGGGRSWRLPSRPIDLVRKYHGYAFAWATIYTLWYHPMESTAAHVTGFLHTGMLLIQQSLIFTPLHLNKTWRLVLEGWVAIHGAVTAAQTQGKGMIGMFLFGFLWMTAFTQVHGLPYYLAFAHVAERERENERALRQDDGSTGGGGGDGDREEGGTAESKADRDVVVVGSSPSLSSLNKWARYVPSSKYTRWILRLVPGILYFIFVVVSYKTWLNNPDQSLGVQMTELTRIPLILYLMAVFVAIIGWGMMSASDKLCGGCRCCGGGAAQEDDRNDGVELSSSRPAEERAVDDRAFRDEEEDVGGGEKETTSSQIIKRRRGVVGSLGTGTVLAVLFVGYAIMVAISVCIEVLHVQMPLIMLMVVLVAIFSVLALVVMIVMEKDMKRIDLGPPQLPAASAAVLGRSDNDKSRIIPSQGGGE